MKKIFDNEHHNWVSNTSGASVLDNHRQTDILFKGDTNPQSETVKKEKKDKKDKEERKKKNVKFSNPKTDMSVCNIVNSHLKDKTNNEYRDRLERKESYGSNLSTSLAFIHPLNRGTGYNLNKNECVSVDKDVSSKKHISKIYHSKTEKNFKEYSNDNHDEDRDDVHELGTATK